MSFVKINRYFRSQASKQLKRLMKNKEFSGGSSENRESRPMILYTEKIDIFAAERLSSLKVDEEQRVFR